jgi:alpha-N-acetylglucosamine transferase
MAPLWGSSWSSTVHSMYRYNPLKQQTTDTNGAAASPSSTTSDPSLRPSIGQILMSKRVRYTVTAVFTILLFSLAIRNYDHFPSIDSLRNKAGVETSAAATNSTPECPTAQALLKIDGSKVDWTRFAYTQYVTNSAYLCNSVMIFETLFRLKSRADRVMMYPESMMPNPASTDGTSDDQRLLIKARDAYRVKLVPVNVQRRNGADATWAESFTKLLAFNQTQYDRVLNVDSDSTILQHMDELFLSPPCPVAMPRAYWLFPKDKTLSSQLMLVQPSATEFDRVMQKTEVAGVDDYDMEIVNQLYADQAMILPHRPYDLLTGEFRGDEHEKYLGTDREPWDPVKIYNEAKFLHFSDWPVPKPWITMSQDIREKNQPKCVDKDGQQDCSSRELWNGFYTDFTNRRRSVCDTRTRTRR